MRGIEKGRRGFENAARRFIESADDPAINENFMNSRGLSMSSHKRPISGGNGIKPGPSIIPKSLKNRLS